MARLYNQFKRWTEELSRARYAIFLGAIFFVVFVCVTFLLGELLLISAAFGALAFAGVYYYLNPR